MLSVITATFNNYEELVNTRSSLSDLNIEHLVINGGHCTRTFQFLRENDVRNLSEDDRGISDAFNKGFNFSSGKYITYLNSGDVILDSKYYLEALGILEERSDVDFVYADICFVDNFAGKIRVRSGNSLPAMPYLHPTLIVRRSLMEKIGLFSLDYKIAMDLDFAYRLVRSGAKGHYIPRMVVQMDGQGVSSKNYIQGYKEVLKIIVRNRDFSIRSFIFICKRTILLIGKLVMLKLGAEKLLGKYRKYKYRIKN